MIQTDNFLIAFSLEVGGQFIGLFTLITNSIVLPLAILLLIAVAIDKDLQYIREQLETMEIQAFNIPETSDKLAIKHLREYIIMSLLLFTVISTIYIIAAYLLIRGTRNVRKFSFVLKVKWKFAFLLAKSSSSQASQKYSRFPFNFFHLWNVDEVLNQLNAEHCSLRLPFRRGLFTLEKVQRRRNRWWKTRQWRSTFLSGCSSAKSLSATIFLMHVYFYRVLFQ